MSNFIVISNYYSFKINCSRKSKKTQWNNLPHSGPQHTPADHSTPRRTTAHPGGPQHTPADHSTPRRTTAHPGGPQHTPADHSAPRRTTAHPGGPQRTPADHSAPRRTYLHVSCSSVLFWYGYKWSASCIKLPKSPRQSDMAVGEHGEHQYRLNAQNMRNTLLIIVVLCCRVQTVCKVPSLPANVEVVRDVPCTWWLVYVEVIPASIVNYQYSHNRKLHVRHC